MECSLRPKMPCEKTYPRPLTLAHTSSHPAATCKGAKLEHGVLRADGSVPGRQRYRRAWGSLPAARGPPTKVRYRGSTPAPTRDAREDGGFTARKDVRVLSGCECPGAGSAAARCMNKTWHCHGAAKAASEIENDKSERPRRPVPCLIAIGDSRSASRPPMAFAVLSFFEPIPRN